MYHVAIDIGGTFTDCAILDAEGRIATVAKSLSTPPNFAQGFIASLAEASASLDLTPEALLAETDVLIHGCTVATNAMIERKGVRTGLITTRGHEDAIFIGKVAQKVAGLSEREIIHQSRLTKAEPPIVDRLDVRGISERIDSIGEILVDLNEGEVETAVTELTSRGIESVAIAFLWSFFRDDHERRARAIIEKHAPGLAVYTSSEVAPILGEYERTATVALTAYLGPRVLDYARDLETRLKEMGYARGLLFSHCLGGLTTLKEVALKPLLTLDSGPAGGVLGASFFARIYGKKQVICSDMGGTSFDVSVITGGKPTLDEEPVLEKYTFLIPKIAINTIGAGGGSIVWLDEDGLLRVGPQSAGSTPGPAAYGRGGDQPTVTDVDLILGYLNPDNFLGGRMKLNVEQARNALRPIAGALNMSLEETAAGAFKIVNAHMADLIRQATIEQGHDPRNFVLFCYGGAGPAHSPFLGRELGIGEIYVPSHATVFSALGMLTGGLVHSLETSFPVDLPLSDEHRTALEERYRELERKLHEQFAEEGIDEERVDYQRILYMKYRLQPNGMGVVLSEGLSLDDDTGLSEAFRDQYASVYGEISVFRNMSIEVLKCRVVGRCATVTPDLQPAAEATETDPNLAKVGERAAYFAEHNTFVDTPIYDGGRLEFGHQVAGPCIVERPGNALVIPPAMIGAVDEYLNLRITPAT